MTVDSQIALAATRGADRPVSLAVASLLLNAVPVVGAAEPGLINNLTLAPRAGGYLSL